MFFSFWVLLGSSGFFWCSWYDPGNSKRPGVVVYTTDDGIAIVTGVVACWFLCASAEKFHARGPLPVKEIAIYYWRTRSRSDLSKIRTQAGIFLLSPSAPSRSVAIKILALRSLLSTIEKPQCVSLVTGQCEGRRAKAKGAPATGSRQVLLLEPC